MEDASASLSMTVVKDCSTMSWAQVDLLTLLFVGFSDEEVINDLEQAQGVDDE